MVVLVTRQGSATSESLLTIGVWALVGAFARMDSAMSCERGRVTEGLLYMDVSKVNTGQARVAALTFPQRSHMWGFSPVWTRECTVKAERWMNCLPQPGKSQT